MIFVYAAPSPAAIRLKTGVVDTSARTQVQAAAPSHGSGHYLVELRGPATLQSMQAIAQAGALIIEYVPDYAYLVRVEHARVHALRELSCVQWVGPYEPAYKFESLLSAAGKERPQQYVVLLFPGVSKHYACQRIKLAGARLVENSASENGQLIRILATRSQIAQLIQLESVAWVEPYVQPKLCNDVASSICGVPEIRQNPGLFGAGQVLGIADAGLANGNLATISPDFAGRIKAVYALRRPGDWSDQNGHGTHVTGTAVGSGADSGSNPAVHSYSGSFAGYAPEAQLVFQSIGDSGGFVFPPLHLGELFQPAYDNGARVHSDSWGSAVKGAYTTYSSEVDQFAWDHKDFLATFSVGNDAVDLYFPVGVSDPDCIYAPATAKNCIAVGASETLRTTGGYQMGYGIAWPNDFPSAPIKYDLMSNTTNGMAAFSGRGPTDDGRIKPDIVAPGTNIISCRCAAGVTGWAAYDEHYMYWGGTSMATPQVAGAAALVREYYQTEKSLNPSAALVKATLLAGAIDMSPGQYGTGSTRELYPVPDVSQGWGRLSVKNSIFPDPPLVNEFTDEATGLSTGETREYLYNVVDTSVPLKATLVWTDYPGAVYAAKELVNDLDLTLVSPTGGILPVNGICDHTNNVEQVKITSPGLGVYKVRVTGYNVPMGPQDYALVVSGGLPNAYISGTVTSSSGAGVQGAIISIVSATEVRRLSTNLSGQYLARVEPGTYSVQIGKQGWSFTPRSRTVEVASAPVEHVDFQGTGTPGALNGRLRSVVGGVVSKMLETPHPYLNNCDQTYVISAHSGASHVRVHFAEIDLMSDGDTIYILDAADSVKNIFTGHGEDVWSAWVPGSTVKIRIVTNDAGNIGYGFYIDGYETDLIDSGALAGATVTLSPGGFQTTSGVNGNYSFTNIPPGTYTVTPSKAHWKLQPPTKTIEVPAGGAASGVDFDGFPPGSISGQVQIISTQPHAINIQSPHPYPENYTNIWTITADASVTRLRLHFARISTEPAFDLVYLLDEDENIVEIFTAEEADLWTPWVEGHIAKIMLSSDEAFSEWGFYCDGYEAQTAMGGLGGANVQLTTDGRSAVTQADGAFALSDVDVGSHTVSCSLAPWSFDPVSTIVNISAGLGENLLFYAALSDLSLPSQVKLVADAMQVTLKGVVVSAKFNGCFYVQDANRLGGVRVDWSGAVSEGTLVDITGTLSTPSGERRITASSVSLH